jgi:hypothetical protein
MVQDFEVTVQSNDLEMMTATIERAARKDCTRPRGIMNSVEEYSSQQS